MKSRLLVLIALLMFYAPGAQAAVITFEAVLSGPAEIPPVASPGSGSALVTLDTASLIMTVEADFQDLIGTTTASHIHCCTVTPGATNAGVATTTPSFTGFPLGVNAGTYDHTFDMTLASSFNSSFITAQGGIANALTALQAGMATGNAYFNIHTTSFPGGEIRGLLREVPTAVPEPASIILTASALAGAGLRRWRKRRVASRHGGDV
jgi:hypothetical protein